MSNVIELHKQTVRESKIKHFLVTCLFNKTRVQSENVCCQCLSYGLDDMHIAFLSFSSLLFLRKISFVPSSLLPSRFSFFCVSLVLRVRNRQKGKKKEKENVMRKRDMSRFCFSLLSSLFISLLVFPSASSHSFLLL